MQRALCICALIPRLPTRTHLVLLLHQLEDRKTTNTGRLAARCLPNSSVVVRGAGSPVETDLFWPADHQPVYLYPAQDARPLGEFAHGDRPVALIVPDGTWSQASRMRRRLGVLQDVPAAFLPDTEGGAYRLRTAISKDRLSTLEAIARGLGILEPDAGAEIRTALEHIQRVMVDRTLWSSGRLATDQVTGGVPPGVVKHRPW